MDNTWRNIFRDFVACYESLTILESNGVLVDEAYFDAREKLLENIIEAMRQEIEE